MADVREEQPWWCKCPSGETDACLPDPDDKEDDVADLTMMMIRIKRYTLLQ